MSFNEVPDQLERSLDPVLLMSFDVAVPRSIITQRCLDVIAAPTASWNLAAAVSSARIRPVGWLFASRPDGNELPAIFPRFKLNSVHV